MKRDIFMALTGLTQRNLDEMSRRDLLPFIRHGHGTYGPTETLLAVAANSLVQEKGHSRQNAAQIGRTLQPVIKERERELFSLAFAISTFGGVRRETDGKEDHEARQWTALAVLMLPDRDKPLQQIWRGYCVKGHKLPDLPPGELLYCAGFNPLTAASQIFTRAGRSRDGEAIEKAICAEVGIDPFAG